MSKYKQYLLLLVLFSFGSLGLANTFQTCSETARAPVESQPNDQDGVPYLTTPPIAAGSSLTFEYPVTHTGTYWYHAHTGLQEQRGLYGAIVFRNPDETHRYDRDLVRCCRTGPMNTRVRC